MDIQKEREAFECWFRTTATYKTLWDFISTHQTNIKSVFVKRNGKTYQNDCVQIAWSAWQAAKAQAVPEGFVLIKASDRDQEMLELIDQRDYMESQAEELKDKLQTLYGVNFGEHSSCNFPFQNAIDYDDSDLVSVKKNHLSEVIEKIERMFEEDPLLALGELLPIQQGIKAMIEAQEPAND